MRCIWITFVRQHILYQTVYHMSQIWNSFMWIIFHIMCRYDLTRKQGQRWWIYLQFSVGEYFHPQKSLGREGPRMEVYIEISIVMGVPHKWMVYSGKHQ